MLPLAAGDRELLAHGSVPRGILQESPASPAHQGLEVALRVRWRSFMNELSRALGMKCRQQASCAWFFLLLLFWLGFGFLVFIFVWLVGFCCVFFPPPKSSFVWGFCLCSRGHTGEGAALYLCGSQMWLHLCDSCPAGM